MVTPSSDAHQTHGESILDTARDFLSRAPQFVCAFGKIAAKEGKMEIAEISLSVAKEELYPQLQLALNTLEALRGKGGVYVFVEKHRPGSHEEGFQRTFDLYERLVVASHLRESEKKGLGVLRGEALSRLEESAQRLREQAEPTTNLRYLYSSILPKAGNHPVMITAMNPLYDERHTRYAPVTLYALTPYEDFQEAAKDKTIVDAVRRQMQGRVNMSYNGLYPYVIPGDPSFWPEQLKAFASAAKYDGEVRAKFRSWLADESLPPGDREAFRRILQQSQEF